MQKTTTNMMTPGEIRSLWIQERRAAHQGHRLSHALLYLRALEDIMGIPPKHRFGGA